MNLFLTGATGFVGSHLAELLIEKGDKITCLVRDPQKLRYLSDLPVSIISAADFADKQTKYLNAFDAIIHVAGVTKAKTKDEYFTGNVGMTRDLVKRITEAKYKNRVIIISSQAAAGPSADKTPMEINDPATPRTWYGESKLAMEKIFLDDETEINWTILRPTAVFGPRDTDMLESFRFAKRGLNPIVNGIDKLISIIYVKDLARAIYAVLKSPKELSGQTYFVGNSEPVSVTGLNQLVAESFDKKLINIYIPSFMLSFIGELYEILNRFRKKPNIISRQKVKEILPPYWVCDTKTFIKDLNFQTQYSLQEAVEETIAWYRSQGWL